MGHSTGPSQRQLRVGELIRHELASVLARGDIHDAALEKACVTVLEVRPSPDLKIATAYVRPFLQSNADEMLKALNQHSRHIRGLLAPKLKLKFMPEVRFVIDTVPDQANRIDNILRDPVVARDLGHGGSSDDAGAS